MQDKGKNVVCVLGMHRSGTSMVARLLNMYGFYIGEDNELLGSARSNEKGHWEHKEVLEINSKILEIFGKKDCWDNPPIFPEKWENDKRLSDLYVQAEKFTQKMNEKSDFWMMKEPRMCLTLPFWRKIVPDMKYVIPVRHPLEVAQSLYKRNGMVISDGILLWLTYWNEILKNTNSKNRYFTIFDKYFIDCKGELKKIFNFLEYESRVSIRKNENFVSKGLRHHNFGVKRRGFIDGSEEEVLELVIEAFKGNIQNAGDEIAWLNQVIHNKKIELDAKEEEILQMKKSFFWKAKRYSDKLKYFFRNLL